LKDAEYWARWFLNRNGLGHFDLIFYQMPDPCGFYYKHAIALSAPFVIMNTMTEVWDAIKHEIAHAIAPQNAEHGATFRDVCYRRLGITTGEFIDRRLLSEGFNKLHREYTADERRVARGERAADYICLVVAADEKARPRKPGMRGSTDLRFVDYGTL